MNEFIVKKMAEVQAFINLRSVILDKAYGLSDMAPRTAAALAEKNPEIGSLIESASLKEVFRSKVQKTDDKLTEMMNLYIGDEWDNPVEVLEWLSFYSGAAAAHAALVAGTLNELGKTDDERQLIKIHDGFWQLLASVKEELVATGVKRVKGS